MVVTFARLPMSAGLLRGPSGNHRAGLNDAQRLGTVSALEAERLIIGAVEANDLLSVQAYTNLNFQGAALVAAAVHHGVKAAMGAVRLVESEHPLAAERGENGVVSSHGAQTLGRLRACG